MKKTLLLAALALSPLTAFADGFKCTVANDSLNVKVFNSTDASIGTRVPAIVVISDSRREFGNKTIATFDGEKGVISSSGADYELNVDHRFKGVEKGGADIAGTKLMYLRKIGVQIDYSYDRPLEDGARVYGTITFTKDNGESSYKALDCNRYLKMK
jgi:hypothetical protein